MKILALEPYYGGSHRAFLDGWKQHSRHEIELRSLPASKWKWRAHHSAVSFAEESAQYDALFCSSMLDLATLRGMAPQLATLPTLLYFHENQLTYPLRGDEKRDYTYAFKHYTAMRCADTICFNSAYHRDEFFDALQAWFRRMPDFHPTDLPQLRSRSQIVHPGMSGEYPIRPAHIPLRILWAARWEYDKDPESFFAALDKLTIPFEIAVIGESFRDAPPIFKKAEQQWKKHIRFWGHQSRNQYIAALQWADVAVSTARHEFFGITMVEAAANGARPVLPHRLAYPEIFSTWPELFYGQNAMDLAAHLNMLPDTDGSWQSTTAATYTLQTTAGNLDRILNHL